MAPSLADVAADPRWLPHRLSLPEDWVELLPTDRGQLRAATFLDGRSDFSTGPAQRANLSALLAASVAAAPPDRFIFHVAFCGSTLLARLLDVPGRSLVLREPNCLVDLATHRAALDRAGRPDHRLDAALRETCALLRRRWEAGEAVIVKPTSWINNLVPELAAERDGLRPLFLTMPRADFVRAVFRGGSERVAFAARAAVHLSMDSREHAEMVAAALGREVDEVAKLGGLAAVLHAIQMRLFHAAAEAGEWGAEHWLSLRDIISDPHASARRAAYALELEFPEEALAANCAEWASRHAKQPEAFYSAGEERQNEEQTMAAHRDTIDAILTWADKALGSESVPPRV